MPRLTPEQLTRRKDGLGASEVGILLGLDKYATPLDLYNLKVHGIERARTSGLDEAAEWGHRMEPVIASMWADRMGLRMDVDVLPWTEGAVRDPRTNLIFATPDYVIVNGNGERSRLLEIKNRGFTSRPAWGTPGAPTIDPRVFCQVQMQMYCTGIHEAALAVCIGGNTLRTYDLAYDPGYAERAAATVVDWWERHVIPQIPPTEETPRC